MALSKSLLNQYNTVLQLTAQPIPWSELYILLNDFATELGWNPSDRIFAPHLGEFANAHILVEHGLENTAVITFLRSPRQYSDLDYFERNSLLTLSYNNLVDWHIHVDASEVNTVYNRVRSTDPSSIVDRYRLSQSDVSKLRSERFEQITGKRPNPNIPALDDALINTISDWKRKLSAEMEMAVPNQALSALFNAIIFVRAVEDNTRQRSYLRSTPSRVASSELLLHYWRDLGPSAPIRDVLHHTIKNLIAEGEIPSYLFNYSQLRIFNKLDPQTVFNLISDFYRNRSLPYSYDFSVMSKHALSRIYEHYVSILKTTEKLELSQMTMFQHRLPEAEKSKAFGSVYTPQFVARFFAKYLREQMPPMAFKRIQVADPACGSGIFLRTLLELQFDLIDSSVTTSLINSSFENVLGVDYDENACHATRLSLSLLYLVLTDTLPSELRAPNKT